MCHDLLSNYEYPIILTCKTVIFVPELSKTGKTTICRFLENDSVKHLSTDCLFVREYVEKLHVSDEDSKKKYISFLKTHKRPSAKIIHFTPIVVKKHRQIFIDLLISTINKTLKDDKVKLVLVEGYSLRHKGLMNPVVSYLKKNNTRIWNMVRL